MATSEREAPNGDGHGPPPGDGDGQPALVAALRAGDERAYETLVRSAGGRMLAVARRFLPEEEARDAVQEAFLSAFRSIESFDGRSQLSTWLHRIVVNAALMRLRKPEARNEESIEPLLPLFDARGHWRENRPAWTAEPPDLLRQAELREVVGRSLAKLPASYRTVLLLRDVEGYDGNEAAELLGTTPGALKVRLHRARLAMRELVDAELREEVGAP